MCKGPVMENNLVWLTKWKTAWLKFTDIERDGGR